MSNNKKNRYAQKAHRATFVSSLKEGLHTKGDAKNSAIATVVDLAVGVIGGGLLGAAIGKPSLLAGIAVTGAGHLMGQRWLSMAGVGMMAANVAKSSTTTVSGLEGMDGVKERMIAYKNGLVEKLYLDKFLKKNQPVEGMGNLQYFNYPDEVGSLADLNTIERQLEESAMNRMQISGMGAADAVEAMEGGLSDVSDYNL